MVRINQELKAAKAAKAASGVLSAAITALNRANHVAIVNLSAGGDLNEARGKVGLALSSLLHTQLTQEKIDRAKAAIDGWIKELAKQASSKPTTLRSNA